MCVRVLMRIQMCRFDACCADFLNLRAQFGGDVVGANLSGRDFPTKDGSVAGKFPSASTNELTSLAGAMDFPPIKTKWQPTPSFGLDFANVTASSKASPFAISVVLLKMPSWCARKIPSFMPGVNPKSSALRITSFIGRDGSRMEVNDSTPVAR